MVPALRQYLEQQACEREGDENGERKEGREDSHEGHKSFRKH